VTAALLAACAEIPQIQRRNGMNGTDVTTDPLRKLPSEARKTMPTLMFSDGDGTRREIRVRFSAHAQ